LLIETNHFPYNYRATVVPGNISDKPGLQKMVIAIVMNFSE